MAHTPDSQNKEQEVFLQRLTHLAEALGTAREFVAIWRALRVFAEAHVPCIGIFISLYDPERDARTAVYAYGDSQEPDVSTLPPMPVSAEGPNSRAVRTRQVVITNDYWNTKLQGKGQIGILVGPDNGLRPQSSLVVPMMTMGRVVGTVEVQSYEDDVYRPEHVTAMRMAANLAAVAVENMRLLEREREARAAAEESNRLKDEFLATLSHELRTPLTAILGWAGMLRAGRLDEESATHAVEVIERNAHMQKQIVDDILDVSRIITGKLHIDAQPTDLAAVARAAVEAMRPAADAKGLALEADLEAGDGVVLGDPARLQQVVWNLLANAVKFTPAGGRVRVSVRAEAAHARLRVEDTGVGIRPDFLPFVFDRFRQGDQSTTRAFGGIGLGLSIVRHLVELHGGAVRAESEGPDRGAAFTVELPLARHADLATRVEEGAPSETGRLATGEARRAVLSGLRVLVVDDDEDTLALLATLLRRAGAEVATAADTRGALESFKAARPDVLLSDIGMPGEDGYDLMREVREFERVSGGPATRAVALTAYVAPSDRDRALAAGFQRHLPKPVHPSELVEAIAGLSEPAQT
ncbi:MAG TPA: ATP-binding protein [Pyrinomonadaceae bacterium]